MKDEEDGNMNFSENLLIISSRKAEFLYKFIERLKKEDDESLTPTAISEIVGIVASLDPLLFVSPKELKEKRLFLDTTLEDIDRGKIGNTIAEKIKDSLTG